MEIDSIDTEKMGPKTRARLQRLRDEGVKMRGRGRPEKLPRPPILSEGQRLLLEVEGTLATIGAVVGASVSSVGNWRTGDKTPGPIARAQLMAAYGIPESAWHRTPSLSPEELEAQGTPDMVPSPPGGGGALSGALRLLHAPSTAELEARPPSSLEDCLALLAIVREERSRPNMLASERAKLVASESKLIALRSKLEEAAELAEARYVLSHPAWIRLRKVIVAALEPHPLAVKAVITAIASMEDSKPMRR